MSTTTKTRTRKGSLIGLAVLALFTAGLATASPAVAAKSASTNAVDISRTVGSGQNWKPTGRDMGIQKAGRDMSAQPDARCCQTPLNYVRVYDALLRAAPNTHSTKLDVSQYGRGVDLYCWVDTNAAEDYGYIWFYAHPWGSRYTGWMRADLIHWGTYPSPGEC